MGRRKRITNVKFRNPTAREMQCVVHDRVWVFDDILLVDGLESGCTVANVKARVNELRGIPGSNMEVVIFFVNGSDRCSTTGDISSAGGSSRDSERKGAPREDGPISVCLWKPKKSGKDRYLVTRAASPA